MYSVAELRKDTIITFRGQPYKIVEYQHTKLGRGGAIARTKLKNLIDGSVISETFKGSDKIEPAQVESVDMQYLYRQGANMTLMDLGTYEQTTIETGGLGSGFKYLPEGANVVALRFNNRIIDVEVPAKVSLKITEAEPGLQGDRTKAALKPATLETGATVFVPLFIKAGDTIRIDTATGNYVERVS